MTIAMWERRVDSEEALRRAVGAIDPRLDSREGAVWSRVAEAQRQASGAAIWGWRGAAAALLLTIGILVAGDAREPAPSEMALFSSKAAFAPSTLLGESE